MRPRRMLIASALLLLSGLAVSVHAQARAAASVAAGEVTSQAVAPDCVLANLDDSGWTDHLTVTNHCTENLRIKVVLARATDKPCQTFLVGQHRQYEWGWPGAFDHLELC